MITPDSPASASDSGPRDMTVTLPRPLANQLLAHAQSAPETEICGLIGARNGAPASRYPVANIAETPTHLFAMDPQEQIEAFRTMRDRDEALFAIYHSHPGSPAAPSATDLAQANYPDALYLIISLQTRGVLELRGYTLREGGVQEVELEIQG